MQQQSGRDGVVVVQALTMRKDTAAERARDRLRSAVFSIPRQGVGHGAAPEEGQLVLGSERMVQLERWSLCVPFDQFRILEILRYSRDAARRPRRAQRQRNQVLDS